MVFATLSYLLYKQVVAHKSYNEVAAHFRDGLSGEGLMLLLLLLIAMLLNWYFEISKWKLLIQRIQPITFFRAINGVLFGITFSLFTPNRVGEFGGRVVALQTDKLKAVVATLLGSFSQIVANLVLGGLGLVIYFFTSEQADFIPYIFVFLWVILAVGLPAIYFNMDMIEGILLRIPILKRIKSEMDVIQLYSRKELVLFLTFSAARCLVYYFQYYLCLRFFGVEVQFSQAILIIPAIFFVQTVIPSFAILGPVLGGSIALNFLGMLTDNSAGVVYATFLLWFVNLIIPAGVGLLLFTQHKLAT